MNCLWSSEYVTVFTLFTRATFLNMRVDQSSSLLIRTSFPKSTILYSFCLTIAFVKCPKNVIPRHFLNVCLFFFFNIWIYLRLILFSALAFLTFDLRLST